MKLQETLDALKKEKIASMPPETVATLTKGTKDLINSGIADKAIKVGATLPEFTLPDEQGNLVSSSDLLVKGPLAISFYRGVW